MGLTDLIDDPIGRMLLQLGEEQASWLDKVFDRMEEEHLIIFGGHAVGVDYLGEYFPYSLFRYPWGGCASQVKRPEGLPARYAPWFGIWDEGDGAPEYIVWYPTDPVAGECIDVPVSLYGGLIHVEDWIHGNPGLAHSLYRSIADHALLTEFGNVLPEADDLSGLL